MTDVPRLPSLAGGLPSAHSSSAFTSASSVSIHPTAVVEDGVELGAGVEIGPFCYVGSGVLLGPRCRLESHATVLGPATFGSRNRIYPHAVIGAAPQDRSYRGEPTRLVIGDENELREHVTVHRGTERGGGETRIGSGCLLMVGVHVAHDSVVGDGVVLANQTSLGGHVRVGDHVVCGGHVAVAPFVRLGRLCFIAGGAMVERNVPPFVIAAGDRARVRGINRVGLCRAGVPRASVRALKGAYRMLFGSRQPQRAALSVVRAELGNDVYVRELLDSL